MNPAPEAILVADYLALWLDHARTRVRARTYQGYESLIRLYAVPRIGEVCLSELTALGLQGLYGELLRGGRLSGGTVLNLHLVLTQAFSQAVRWGIVAYNPAAGAQPPRPRRAELTAVDESIAGRLLEVSRGTRFELPVAVAIATGMRRGEILALRWSDVSRISPSPAVTRSLQPTMNGLVFEPPKTKRSRRSVVLPTFLAPYLARQCEQQAGRRTACGAAWEEHGLVIDRGNGRPVNPDTLSSGWRTFVRKNALPPIRFHDLRHAHATLMLAKGIHPKIVSERLGHASVGITLDTYSHVLPAMQHEAAQAFDELFPAAVGA